MFKFKKISSITVALALVATCSSVMAANNGNDKDVGKAPVTIPIIPAVTADSPVCKNPLLSHAKLLKALKDAQTQDNGGFGLNMWGTIVDRDGVVCAVAKTGDNRGDQWPGSRVISAQKANTANAFSLPTLALSTANLYSAVQPGGSLFGLQESNPVDTTVAYSGAAIDFGTPRDPMTGKRIGGVNVFGGGLALYSPSGVLLGGIGVSGDSSCADHNIAWRTRRGLGLDKIPGGVAPDKSDNIVFDIVDTTGKSKDGWGHPTCSEKSSSANADIVGSTAPAL